jgi:hypothetical protein
MYTRFSALGGALRALLVVAPLTVAATSSQGADGFARISEAGVTHKQTVWKSNGELTNELTSCPASYTTILSVTVPKVDAGQTLSIDADMEATSPNIAPILLSTYVTINGTGVDSAQGSNVTPQMHHMDVTRAAFWQSPADLKNVVVQLVARACNDTIGPGQVALQVEQGYGTVFVKVN